MQLTKSRLTALCVALLLSLTGGYAQDQKIFVWGGDINLKFTRYIAELTGKEHPRLCYLPTASGDHPDNIQYWNSICHALQLDTLVMKVWVSSSPHNISFEEALLHSDAIVVGGGNTLNMLGIWRAQGIDKILEKALKRGIILSGGSAGSLCWFDHGVSDSRPERLSVVDGLGFLPYSNCPHYDLQDRRELYNRLIADKSLPAGYAMDENAGILFVNGQATECIVQNERYNAYTVCRNRKQGVDIEPMDRKIVIAKGALSENAYETIEVNRKLSDLVTENSPSDPLSAYVAVIREVFKEPSPMLDSSVNKIFIYKDRLAGVVNDKYLDSMGVYGLWYFYNDNRQWVSAGEDIGGATLLESEVTFREKARTILTQQAAKTK